MLSHRRSLLGAVAAATALSFAAGSMAQQAPAWNTVTKRVWAFNVPDFYQHQKLGKTEAGGQNDSEWEAAVKVVAGSAVFDINKRGGWCRLSAFMDAFYYWRKAGYNGMMPNAGAITNAEWLHFVNLYTKQFALLSFRQDKPAEQRGIKAALKVAGHGEEKGVSKPGDAPKKGLAYVLYGWDAAAGRATYPSSDGVAKFADGLGFPLSLFDHAALRVLAGSSVTPHLLKAGATDASIWWDYHNVTIGGVDIDDRQFFIADPDCNRGDKKADAGWVFPQARKYKAWDGTDDVIPVPTPGAGNPPADPADFAKKFVTVKLAADGRTIDGTEVANERYRKVVVNFLEVIEPVRAAPKAAASLVGGTGLSHLFEVTPGSLFAMNEFWIFPTRPVDGDVVPSFVTDDAPGQPRTWEVTAEGAFTGLVDPFGNPRSMGGVHVVLLSGPALGPDEVGELSFGTAVPFAPLSDGYDILTRHPAITGNAVEFPQRMGSALGEYFAVQAIGEGVQPFAPDAQQTAWDACPADFNLDGMIDGADLAVVLGNWNSTDAIFGDLNADGIVNGADLSALLSAWGPCSAQ